MCFSVFYIEILRQRTTNVELKKYATDLMKSTGSFDYTRKTMDALDTEIRSELEKFGGNPYLIALLDELKKQVDSTLDKNRTI